VIFIHINAIALHLYFNL